MNRTEDSTTIKKQRTAAEFDRFVERYLNDCLRAVSLPLMQEIFEPIIPELTSEIEEYHKQGEDFMVQEFKKGLYKIIETRHLVQKQNKFDDLKEDAKNRGQEKVLLVPTPTQVFNAVVYKEKEAELMRLQNLLDQTTKENYVLMNKIEVLHNDKSDKETKIQEKVDRFNRCLETASSIPTEELIGLMKELDLKEPRI